MRAKWPGSASAPDPDETSLSGWVDTPPDQPDWDWLGEMDPIDRLYLAIDQLIASGELGEDFWDALPDPHAFVLGLLAIVILQFVPGIDLILDAYLAYMLGSGFIDLLDALSAISTARTPRISSGRKRPSAGHWRRSRSMPSWLWRCGA